MRLRALTGLERDKIEAEHAELLKTIEHLTAILNDPKLLLGVIRTEMDAIAAVVMGGTSIAGGKGSIIGTFIGALMLGVLNNGLNMMGVSPYVQNIIKGLIILFAIYISRERKKRR